MREANLLKSKELHNGSFEELRNRYERKIGVQCG
jgi:hypothetical protein